jgi:hypothetical protein
MTEDLSWLNQHSQPRRHAPMMSEGGSECPSLLRVVIKVIRTLLPQVRRSAIVRRLKVMASRIAARGPPAESATTTTPRHPAVVFYCPRRSVL